PPAATPPHPRRRRPARPTPRPHGRLLLRQPTRPVPDQPLAGHHLRRGHPGLPGPLGPPRRLQPPPRPHAVHRQRDHPMSAPTGDPAADLAALLDQLTGPPPAPTEPAPSTGP